MAEAKVSPEWHIYSLKPSQGSGPRPTSLELREGSKLKADGDAVEPAATIEFDQGFKTNVAYFEKAVAYGLPVLVAPDAKGAQKATLQVRYMICKHGTCMPPAKAELPSLSP